MYKVIREIDGEKQVIGYAESITEMVLIIDADRKANKNDALYYAEEEE